MKGKLVHLMQNKSWLCDLTFLIDITTHLNELKTMLQQSGQYANDMHIKAFQNKLRLWKRTFKRGYKPLPNYKETELLPEKKTEFADYLQNLLKEFLNRFQDLKSHKHLLDILSLPFQTDVDKATTEFQLELIELQVITDLKAK